MQRRDDERDDAEHRILEQRGREDPGLAQQGLQAGVAGQRYGRELDRKIAQVKRVTDGDKGRPATIAPGRASTGMEFSSREHVPASGVRLRANMVGNVGRDKVGTGPLIMASKGIQNRP